MTPEVPQTPTPQPYTPDELESIRASASVNDKFGFVHVDYDRMKATADSIRELEEKVTAAHAVVAGLEKSLDQAYTWFKESQAQVQHYEANISKEESARIFRLEDEGNLNVLGIVGDFLVNRRSKP